MSKQHFEAIAAALLAQRPTTVARKLQWIEDCSAVAQALRATSPNFQGERFMIACGVIRAEVQS